MKTDPDFSLVTFKVNASGSWANLVVCDGDRMEEVKAACEVIAKGSRVTFKVLDAAGGELEHYGYDRRSGRVCWHAPRRGTR